MDLSPSPPSPSPTPSPCSCPAPASRPWWRARSAAASGAPCRWCSASSPAISSTSSLRSSASPRSPRCSARSSSSSASRARRYLLYIAWKFWTAKPGAEQMKPKNEDFLETFLAGFSLTMGNPKTIVFYLAILPTVIPLDQMTAARLRRAHGDRRRRPADHRPRLCLARRRRRASCSRAPRRSASSTAPPG